MSACPSPPGTHVRFYAPKGGQGTSTVAAAFALFAARFGERVGLRAHDVSAMAALLGLPTRGPASNAVNAVTELASLDDPPRTRIVVDDADHDSAGHPEPEATRIMVLRPCHLALDAAVAAASHQRRPDFLIVVAEPHRSLGPNDLADALGVPVAAVLPADPAVARAAATGLRGALEGSRTPRSLAPLLDLAGRLLAAGEPAPLGCAAATLPQGAGDG